MSVASAKVDDADMADDIDVQMSPAMKKQRRASGTGRSRKPANLACLNCRPRKIKVGLPRRSLNVFVDLSDPTTTNSASELTVHANDVGC